MASFPTRIRHIQDGEAVSAGVTSRPDRALQAQTAYLKETLDSIEAGQALIQRGASCDPDVNVGQPVYFNATTQRYELARAGAVNDTDSESIVTLDSAAALGLVYAKGPATNQADIVLMGLVSFADLSNAIDGDLQSGWYYLSAASEGKLVYQRPPVSVPVAFVYGAPGACDSETLVFVMPQMGDFLHDHVHYQVELVARPAGTHVPPAAGETHSIENADTSTQGWLPADHAIFEGNAPAGAQFGYNLSAHAAVSRIWPPIPPGACTLEIFSPDDAGTMEGAGRATPELVRFTNHGIWWMSNCYGTVPWPVDYQVDSSSSSSAASESSESSAGPECPTPTRMRLVLSFVKMAFAASNTVVTSLQPDTDQPIEFVNCDGEAAATGDLFAKLNLAMLLDDDEYYGGQVLKELVTGFKFGRGWVAEGVIAGSDYVSLSSTRQRRETPGDASTSLVHQGLITIDLNPDPSDRELSPTIVRLGDALEREYRNAMYIGLPNGRDSGVRLRFNIPYAGLPTTPKFKLRVLLLAPSTGNMPELTAAYYQLARPEAGSPVELTEGDTSLSGFDTTIAVVANYTYEIDSAEIDVAAGDVIYVDIARDADAVPAYGADVGLLRIAGVISAGT